jgi:hypothetical protein
MSKLDWLRDFIRSDFQNDELEMEKPEEKRSEQ